MNPEKEPFKSIKGNLAQKVWKFLLSIATFENFIIHRDIG
jgi:hypothetical protein